MRALAGFLIAPLPVALLQSLTVALQPRGSLGVTQHPSSMFVAIAAYFYFFGLIVGVPLLRATRKRPNHTLPAYAGAAALIMLAPIAMMLIAWSIKGHPPLSASIYLLVLSGLGGAFTGALFWVLVKRKRPLDEAKEAFE